jgi:hypothetical protein
MTSRGIGGSKMRGIMVEQTQRTDLVAALATLDMNYFTHVGKLVD